MPLRLLLCALAVIAAGCGGGPSGDAAGTATDASLFDALCQAAAVDDPGASEAAFGYAHDGLHTLARELQDAGRRAVAGDLLEAKQQVEAAFAADPVPADLADRLGALVDATADALAASGQPRPRCPQRSSP